MRTVRQLTQDLSAAGVELLDEQTMRLKCRACGARWSPSILPGGRFRRGYWRCPTGCHADRPALRGGRTAEDASQSEP